MLAEWVKRKRIERKWTQDELAERAGLDRVEVNAVERGRNKGTSSRIRDGLARAFGVPSSMIGKEPGERVEYDNEPSLPSTAIGHHRNWKEARAEAIRLYGKTIDPDILSRVERASLGEPIEILTAETVKRLHDTIAGIEAEKARHRDATK